MTTNNFSIEYLAMSLIVRLDRNNIFPPLFNNPETYVSSVGPLNNLSSFRPKRPLNAFLICRKNVQEETKRKGTYNMRIISKVTSILWKSASAEEKDVYKKLVERVCELHNKRTRTIYKKIASKKRPPKKDSSVLPSEETLVKTCPSPLLSTPPLPTTYLINYEINNCLFLNDVNIDFNSCTNFNNQITIPVHDEQIQLLPYCNNINNVLVTPQEF